MEANFHSELIEQAILRMEENTPRIAKCLDELTEEEVWQRPNGSSNSVGNLILHLNGNITQYLLSSLGNQPDIRERDLEFSSNETLDSQGLYELINGTVKQAIAVLRNLKSEEMLAIRSVQGFEMSGIAIVMHVVEHYSYHTGQIAFWTKCLKNTDLGFYANLDLNKKNKI